MSPNPPFLFVLLAGVLAVPSWATADRTAGQPPPAAARVDRSQLRRGSSFRVREHFVRPVGDGCTYRAVVTGRITEWLPLHEAVDPARVYVPDLAVRAGVECPDGSAQRMSIGALRTVPLTPGQLEAVIEAQARALNETNARVCTYAPDFRLQGRSLVGVGVTRQCLRARGGGPTGELGPGPKAVARPRP